MAISSTQCMHKKGKGDREQYHNAVVIDNNTICCIIAHEGHLSPDSTACHFTSLPLLHSCWCEVCCSDCQEKGSWNPSLWAMSSGLTVTSPWLAVYTVQGSVRVLQMYAHDIGKRRRTINFLAGYPAVSTECDTACTFWNSECRTYLRLHDIKWWFIQHEKA